MNVRYTRCEGTELFTEDGRRIVDFLSGYCVHNAGHNHPAIVAALQRRTGPARSGDAAKPCVRAGRRIGGANSARARAAASRKLSSAVPEAKAWKPPSSFPAPTPAATACSMPQDAFHGLTCGALSLMDDPFWRDGFGPMLPETEAVPFGDCRRAGKQARHASASRRSSSNRCRPKAAFALPPPGYLETAQALCRRYGTLVRAG